MNQDELKSNINEILGVTLEEPCSDCSGEGERDGRTCESCDGTGLLLTNAGREVVEFVARNSESVLEKRCEECDGTGHSDGPCDSCNETGYRLTAAGIALMNVIRRHG